ncbi:MAG: MFS transporter, partial [Planctomycetaceae bacterium]|nr:MFS transporter [Planctomycetaceae bacterium]
MRATHADRRHELRRNLFAMNADGFCFSVMVGIGETYLPAFVLARGMGELTAALIATVPMLLGSLLQLAAPLILQRVRSYRLFVVGSASLQASSLLVLMLMALADHVPAWAVFIPATVYWAAGLATGPAWNTWVEQLVPHRIRSGFFARRSRLSHIGVLTGLISGGLMLRWSASMDNTIGIFALMFAIGSGGRFVSALMLARQTQAYVSRRSRRMPPADEISPIGRFQEVLRVIRHPGSAGRLVLFLMAMQTAVYVSGP